MYVYGKSESIRNPGQVNTLEAFKQTRKFLIGPNICKLRPSVFYKQRIIFMIAVSLLQWIVVSRMVAPPC